MFLLPHFVECSRLNNVMAFPLVVRLNSDSTVLMVYTEKYVLKEQPARLVE